MLDEVSYENTRILAKLCHHLHLISTKAEKNKMPPDNLAIVWAQNLLKPRVETPATILGDVLYVNDLAAKLIAEASFFFSEDAMLRRKSEWEVMQSNPEAFKRKEEEKKEQKRKKELAEKEREKEDKGGGAGEPNYDMYEVRYKPPKSLTYKAMRLQVSYEAGVKLMDNKNEVKEHYTPDQIRWVASPVSDTVSIDFGSHRSLNNGFLIVKTPRAKELLGVLSEIRERAKGDEVQRRMVQMNNPQVKWNDDDEVKRRKENKRKINDEWMVDFMAKPQNGNISTDDRKQLRKSLTVRYAIKKKDNPVRAAIQEMQLKDNKMADFFNQMVNKVKSGNYTLKQLDTWLKWIGSRIFGKGGGSSDIPKELLDMAEEDSADEASSASSASPSSSTSTSPSLSMKEAREVAGGGSDIIRPKVTPDQLARVGNRPVAHSAPSLPMGRSVIVKRPPVLPPGRSVIVKQRSFEGKSQYIPNVGITNHTVPRDTSNNNHNKDNNYKLHRSDEGDVDRLTPIKPKAGSAIAASRTPPIPPRANRNGLVSSYPSPPPNTTSLSATASLPAIPTTSPSKIPPPVPQRDRGKSADSSPSSSPPIANGLISPRNKILTSYIPTHPHVPQHGTPTTTGLSAIPAGSKSVRPPRPARMGNDK